GFAGVFAAVTRSGVRHNDAHAGFGNAERAGEFASYAEGDLRARPDGQLAVFPFGKGGAWFQRSVRDVCDGVSSFEFLMRGGESFGQCRGSVGRRVRRLAQMLEEFFGRDLRRRLPLGANGRDGPRGRLLLWRDDAGEIAVTYDGHAGQLFGLF